MKAKQRWCAALGYVVVGIIWYLLDTKLADTKFLRFHIKQAVVFLLALVILQVLATLLFFIPYVWLLLALVLFVIGLSGVLYALRGKRSELPLIGRFVKHLEL